MDFNCAVPGKTLQICNAKSPGLRLRVPRHYINRMKPLTRSWEHRLTNRFAHGAGVSCGEVLSLLNSWSSRPVRPVYLGATSNPARRYRR